MKGACHMNEKPKGQKRSTFSPLEKDRNDKRLLDNMIERLNYHRAKMPANIKVGLFQYKTVHDLDTFLSQNANANSAFLVALDREDHDTHAKIKRLADLKYRVTLADAARPAVSDPAGMPSIAAVVESIDQEFQNYPGSMRLQPGRQEWIENM
ncbi:hypothetical protein BU23DRAFT_599567 [Bimuria novae-zelandiae CBS 107.79]|uniref:Uncharacterized protein n=1 Tax=Bimuria novae-zelandiae CBS 107.79 TaxID=1447943 RepID=A0A6A5V5S2_9PLEO|nr:hypothetical protein BU23DRAFT_599567 [Bimuria novae-zelandiae CBS 107.79]